MSVLSSRSTTFVELDDKLDVLVAKGPSLDDEVLGEVASGWRILTGTDGTSERGIIMVRVFWGSRRRGMACGGITSLSCALATAAVAMCSLSFRQLWVWSTKSICSCHLSLWCLCCCTCASFCRAFSQCLSASFTASQNNSKFLAHSQQHAHGGTHRQAC